MSRHARPEPGPVDTGALMSKPLWTIEDLSAYLSVPVATIYKWRTTGEAPRAHKIGRYLRWAPADVFDWLEGKRDADEPGAVGGALPPSRRTSTRPMMSCQETPRQAAPCNVWEKSGRCNINRNPAGP